MEIASIMQQPPSAQTGAAALEWAREALGRIARGDDIVGLIRKEEIATIEPALRYAIVGGVVDALLPLAERLRSEGRTAEADAILQEALAAGIESATLALVEHRWFHRREEASEEQKREAYRHLESYLTEHPRDRVAIHLKRLLVCAGFGAESDPAAAVQLQQQAADLGSSDAMFELYVHYADGLGVEVDHKKALAENERAAELDHPGALYTMGRRHATGNMVEQNLSRALYFYQRADEQGSAEAVAALSVMYALGEGVEPDALQARVYLSLAEERGLDTEPYRAMIDPL